MDRILNRRRGHAATTKYRIRGTHLLFGGLIVLLAMAAVMIQSSLAIASKTKSASGSVTVSRSGQIIMTPSKEIEVKNGEKVDDDIQKGKVSHGDPRISTKGDKISLVECTVSTPTLPPEQIQQQQQQQHEEGAANNGVAANGILKITVRHDLSPIASNIFLELVQAHHFDGVFLFRVLKGFVAQFGVRTAGEEDIVEQYTKPSNVKDDVHDRTLSNVRGTLSFAGGNPATEQVFVNLGNNERLDKENSRPFATVDDPSMQILDQLYTGYKDGQGQVKTLNKGATAMREAFPRMSRVEKCRVVSSFSSTFG